MKRQIITTGDGSKTIHIPEWNEQYHSKHGAVQEARHVFLKMGLHYYASLPHFKKEQPIRLLEIGFGTGLNALLTFFEAKNLSLSITYTGVEAYPISMEEALSMEYPDLLDNHQEANDVFLKMHELDWEVNTSVSSFFELNKRKQRFEDLTDTDAFDLVYFDAFGARVQPELWGEFMFSKMYAALSVNGVLVTYAAKGSVRRAMQAVGFTVERLPGPPGKREMLRARKI